MTKWRCKISLQKDSLKAFDNIHFFYKKNEVFLEISLNIPQVNLTVLIATVDLFPPEDPNTVNFPHVKFNLVLY